MSYHNPLRNSCRTGSKNTIQRIYIQRLFSDCVQDSLILRFCCQIRCHQNRSLKFKLLQILQIFFGCNNHITVQNIENLMQSARRLPGVHQHIEISRINSSHKNANGFYTLLHKYRYRISWCKIFRKCSSCSACSLFQLLKCAGCMFICKSCFVRIFPRRCFQIFQNTCLHM